MFSEIVTKQESPFFSDNNVTKQVSSSVQTHLKGPIRFLSTVGCKLNITLWPRHEAVQEFDGVQLKAAFIFTEEAGDIFI